MPDIYSASSLDSLSGKRAATHKLKAILLSLYQNDILTKTAAAAVIDPEEQNKVNVYLHTHACDYPIPITRFITRLEWSETSSMNGGTCSFALKMPIDVMQLLFQGDGMEPTTGHWITINRKTNNPYFARGDKFKRRPAPVRPEGVASSMEEAAASVSEEVTLMQLEAEPPITLSDIAAWGVLELQKRSQDFIQYRKQVEEHRKDEQKARERFQRRIDKIYFETFWLGQITNMNFRFAPQFGEEPTGPVMMSQIEVSCQSWEYPLKTATYKIVNANIRRDNRTTEQIDDEAVTEDADGTPASEAGQGARFIVTHDTFKAIIKDVADSIRSAQDLRVPMEKLLTIFAYQKMPWSITRSSNQVRNLIKELAEYNPPNLIKMIQTPVGTAEELAQKRKTIQEMMAREEIDQLVGPDGRVYQIDQVINLSLEEIEKQFFSQYVDEVTVVGERAPPIGKEILVATKQSDLPESAGFLRQLLPETPLFTKDAGRFRELLQQNGTCWTRLVGSFVPDPNIIEFFPVIINFTNDDLKAGFRPRGMMAVQTRRQLCLIWRIKPLRPNEILLKSYYNDKVDFYNSLPYHWRELEKTTLDLASTRIASEDATSMCQSMVLNTLGMQDMQITYDEGSKINGCYLEHAFARSESNLKFGVLSQPYIDTTAAQFHGFKMYEANFPFLDATVTKHERNALTEKAYCALRDEGEGAFGSITYRGLIVNSVKPGIWVSIPFDHIGFDPKPGIAGVIDYDNNVYYADPEGAVVTDNILTCMVTAVRHHIIIRPDGFREETTRIDFMRGKFKGMPTILPKQHDFGRPQGDGLAGAIDLNERIAEENSGGNRNV